MSTQIPEGYVKYARLRDCNQPALFKYIEENAPHVRKDCEVYMIKTRTYVITKPEHVDTLSVIEDVMSWTTEKLEEKYCHNSFSI